MPRVENGLESIRTDSCARTRTSALSWFARRNGGGHFVGDSGRANGNPDDRISQHESARGVERPYGCLHQRPGGRRHCPWSKCCDRVSLGALPIRTITIAGIVSVRMLSRVHRLGASTPRPDANSNDRPEGERNEITAKAGSSLPELTGNRFDAHPCYSEFLQFRTSRQYARQHVWLISTALERGCYDSANHAENCQLTRCDHTIQDSSNTF